MVRDAFQLARFIVLAGAAGEVAEIALLQGGVERVGEAFAEGLHGQIAGEFGADVGG